MVSGRIDDESLPPSHNLSLDLLLNLSLNLLLSLSFSCRYTCRQMAVLGGGLAVP